MGLAHADLVARFAHGLSTVICRRIGKFDVPDGVFRIKGNTSFQSLGELGEVGKNRLSGSAGRRVGLATDSLFRNYALEKPTASGGI